LKTESVGKRNEGAVVVTEEELDDFGVDSDGDLFGVLAYVV